MPTIDKGSAPVGRELEIAPPRPAPWIRVAQDVTRLLATAGSDIPATLDRVLEAIARGLDCEVGLYWSADAALGVLRCERAWHEGHPAIAEFERISRAMSLARGIGRPGEIWRTGVASAGRDVTQDPRFARGPSAERAGLRWTFGLPIAAGDTVVGVAEFFGRTPGGADGFDLRICTGIGTQIGHFLRRAGADADLQSGDAVKAAIVRTAPDAVITIDERGVVRGWNPAAERIFGHASTFAVGRELADLVVPPALRAAHRRGLARFAGTGRARPSGERVELSALHADGHEFPVELILTVTSQAPVRLVTAFVRDVTERRRTEGQREYLAALSELLAATLEVGPLLQDLAKHAVPGLADACVLFATGLDGRVERIALAASDPALTAAIGATGPSFDGDEPGMMGAARALAGETLHDAPSGAEDPGAVWLQALGVRARVAVPLRTRGRVVAALVALHAGSGRRFTAEDARFLDEVARRAAVYVDNARLFREAGRLIGELERANQELDRFASVASHDLKAPLRGIANLSQWLEDDVGPSLPADAKVQLGLLRSRVRRMETLVDGILRFARAGRAGGTPTPVDVAALVRECAELLQPSPGARVLVEPGLPVLFADRTALQQIFLNLIGNALKHARREAATVRIGCREDGGERIFSVADDGPGVPASAQETVWKPFRTLDDEDGPNTGIGLAIVRKLVEQHGGRAWIESEPPHGATFCFTWPARAPSDLG